MVAPTYTFYQQINMLTFNPTLYTDGTVTGFSATAIHIADPNGDTAVITGTGFSPALTGTVSGGVFNDPMGHAIVGASHLNIPLMKLDADLKNRAALTADLFNGGVVIRGKTYNDTLVGGTGKDTLVGEGGADTLIGGLGADTLYGGTGASRFVYRSDAESTVAKPDVIADFHNGDKISLKGIAAADKITLHLGATTGHTGDVVLSYNKTSNMTRIDIYTNADAVADARIYMRGDFAGLTAASFIGVSAHPAAGTAASHQAFAAAMAAFAAPPVAAHPLAGAWPALAHPMIAVPRLQIA